MQMAESKTSEKPKASIGMALYSAQCAITAVAKNSRNEFSKYNYVSADAMVSACRDALHANGLMVARTKFELELERGMLTNHFTLSMPSTGESRVDITPWLFVEKGGQPIDKALAGALSSSLNYYLRDLLLVVREEEGSMDRRNDRDHEPRPKAKPVVLDPNESMKARENLRRLASVKGDKWTDAVLSRCASELQKDVQSFADISDDQVVRILRAHERKDQ